ncbi:MAG TPA: histidine kinase dimerization/phospho-acceptor domain-containing protein, partial [Actinomycetota bacterium]
MPPLEILALGLGLAALICLIALLLAGRRASRSIHRLATGVERLGQEDPLTDPGPMQEGPEAARRLGRALERMRQRLASRMAALERDRATRDAILAALDEGIVLFDGSGSVLYANGSARRLLGTAVANAKQLVPTSLRGMVEAAAGGGRPSPAETALGADGRTIQATAVQVPDDRSVLLILRDTTQTRRVDAIRRDFVANASHELKTPVASILALSETLRTAADDDPEAVARFLSRLEREAERLAALVGDLLELSRLEGGTPEPAEVRLDRVVEVEAERLRTRAEGAGLRIRVEVDGPLLVLGS